MTQPRSLVYVGLMLAMASAGCGGEAALHRQAEVACEAVSAAAAARQARPSRVAEAEGRGTGGASSEPAVSQTLFFAPRDAEGEGKAVGEPSDEPDPAEAETPAVPVASWHFASIKGRSMGAVVGKDILSIPRGVSRGFKHTYTKPENLIILGTAFGADRIIRHNLDGDIRDDLRYDDTSLAETGDFGTVIGNPALHFGVAGAWYLTSLHKQDQGQYEKSRTMIQALLVNSLSTMLLKVSMDDETPNDEDWGWPSGHTSSSMCFASVMHEYYGWKAGVPLYLLAGYSAATRLEDREHDLSDVVFGAALGLVVGHSVVQGELPQVAGFHLLPYGGRGAGGLM
ncbi:MAG: phosphatase PAP2 family protein, partial [Planctomycetota bacterium]|nr:phosphatase PAP2 family protein [Planctomycetota bacterium]